MQEITLQLFNDPYNNQLIGHRCTRQIEPISPPLLQQLFASPGDTASQQRQRIRETTITVQRPLR